MKKYLIIYDLDCKCAEFEAISLHDCIVQFAKYTGDFDDLFAKAISGLNYDAAEDFAAMYNHFSLYKIRGIYLIAKELYKEED